MIDPIVDECRKAGQDYIDQFKGDQQAMLADLRKRQEEFVRKGGRMVSLPAKQPRQRQHLPIHSKRTRTA